jgi:Tfp pilus assembly protein PilN
VRELEFLPDWYAQTRRRRRVVILLGWLTAAIVVALGSWLVLMQSKVTGARAALVSVDHELGNSRSELVKLDELLELERQLQRQQQILNKVGMHVEGARLMTTLDEVIPAEMALVELDYKTMERVRELPQEKARAASIAAGGKAQDPPVDRWLEVKLVGVAPSDVDLANFLAKLTSKPFFSAVRMGYAKDRVESGHLMRQFEVQFSMDLKEPSSGA